MPQPSTFNLRSDAASFFRRGAVAVLLGLSAIGQPASVASADDRTNAVMLLSLRESEQVRRTAHAIVYRSLLDGMKENERLVEICERTKESMEELSLPIMKQAVAFGEQDPAVDDVLTKLALLQQLAYEEIIAVQAVLESDDKGSALKTFGDLDSKMDDLYKQTTTALHQLSKRGVFGPQQQSQIPQPRKVASTQGVQCPLSWSELTQMTGPEGASARYIRSPGKELQRVESLYRGSVVVAVTKVDGGFRVTVASEPAVADFTSRPWFTPAETDGLIEAYSQYVAKAPGSSDEKVIGRFRVQMEQDPQLPIRPSFVLLGDD